MEFPTSEREKISQRLLAPFSVDEMEARPGAWIQGKAKPLFYIDPRVVEHRLRKVFGIGGFSTHVTHLNTQEDRKDIIEKKREEGVDVKKVVGEERGLLVVCSVSIKIHTPEISFEVSNIGEKGLDEPNYNKATSAFAQAFKRAAVEMGIGAYLYNLDLPPLPVKFGRFEGQVIPPDDKMDPALEAVGFRSICEETGEKVPWKIAAKSVSVYGRVLSANAIKTMRSPCQLPEVQAKPKK